MNKVDKFLKYICHVLSIIFGLMAAIAIVGCVFGLLLVAYAENSVGCLQQVRALGLVAIASFMAGATFSVVADKIE